MNKKELVDVVAEKTGLSKKDTGMVVDTAIESIVEAMSNGEKVQIVGFGTFEVRQRSARNGRNPQTGEPMVIPATTVPAFKAGKKLKEAVK